MSEQDWETLDKIKAIRALEAERDEILAALKAAKFSPLGDNHHNAAACPYCSDLLRKEHNRAEEALAHLKSLLAIIHRDGGHYTEQHGLEKAVQDAHTVWADLMTKAEQHDEALAQMAVLVGASQKICDLPIESCFEDIRQAALELQKALSNLPAAAKEMVEKVRQWDNRQRSLKEYGN